VLAVAGVDVQQMLTDSRTLTFVVAGTQRLLAVRELHAALLPARAKLEASTT
jgi:aspartokinase